MIYYCGNCRRTLAVNNESYFGSEGEGILLQECGCYEETYNIGYKDAEDKFFNDYDDGFAKAWEIQAVKIDELEDEIARLHEEISDLKDNLKKED